MIVIEKITDVFNYIDGLKVILFDLDDTLYSEKEYIRSGYHEIAKLLLEVENAEEKLWYFFEQKKSAIDELLVSENRYSEQLKKECLEVYRKQKPNIHLYPEVEQMLVKLKELGYGLGIITDGRPEGQRAKIKSLDLERYFDKIIITDELGGIDYRKPNPLSFEMMKNYFGCQYNEMCYVGDNINKDFIAPNKLGMNAMFFMNYDSIYSVERGERY